MTGTPWYPPVRAPWKVDQIAAVDDWQDHYLLNPVLCPLCDHALVRVRDIALSCPEGHWSQYWYPGVILAAYKARMEHW